MRPRSHSRRASQKRSIAWPESLNSDRIIEGSPKNSTSSVPIMPWGTGIVAKCADWIEK